MEVYYNSEWGTVCDDGWDLNDAQVVCNELGIGNAVAARHNAFYGQGNGEVWLENLKCVGTESTIRDCAHRGWGMGSCSHSEDAGVKCIKGDFTITYTYVRTYVRISFILWQPFNNFRIETVQLYY